MELKYIDNESLYQNISRQNRPDILNTTRFLNEHDVPLRILTLLSMVFQQGLVDAAVAYINL